MAHALLGRAGEHEAPLALLLEGVALVGASIGAVKAGVVQVPLDADYPRPRLAYMLDQSGAGAILTSREHRELARELAGPDRRVVHFDEIGGSGPTGNPGHRFDPGADVAVEYTSGSTGRPKGTRRSHRGVLHDVLRHTNMSRLCPEDRLATAGRSFVPYHHALLNGATFCPFNRGTGELDDLARWFIDERVTVCRSAVSTFRAFVATLTGAERFPDLRLIELFGKPELHQHVRHYFAERGEDGVP